MRVQANSLRLVYPPISNQEGEWLSEIPEFRKATRRSKLYMIGQRPELLFRNHQPNPDERALHFDIAQAGRDDVVSCRMPIAGVVGDYDGPVDIELGEKLIRIWPDPRVPDEDPLAWFTPDKLLYDLSNEHIPASAPLPNSGFSAFDLLYVGISKASDSVSRLFDTGHQARLSILSNERQRYPTSRVSDEMTLFLFDIERLGIAMYGFDDIPSVVGEDFRSDIDAVVADAEKAFIKMLSPKYNEVRYVNYPRGADGLYASGLSRYAYAIREDVIFQTPAGVLHGSVTEGAYDVIVVDGDDVRVIGSGDGA